MKLLAVVSAVAVVAFLALRAAGSGGEGMPTGGPSTGYTLDATLPCLQSARLPATVSVSTSSNRQIKIGASQSTYISFHGSDSEAGWWTTELKEGLRIAQADPDQLVFQRGNSMIVQAAPSPQQLSAITACLR